MMKRVMCHQQKTSPRMRFYQTNHLCKLGKKSDLRIEHCGTPALIFLIQMCSYSEQLSETYLIESFQ